MMLANNTVSQDQSRKMLVIAASVLAIVAFFVLTALLWAPTGLDVGFWGDDWLETAYIDNGGGLRLQTIRPMLPLSHLLGYAISPHNFTGLNLVLLIVIALKASFLYLLLRQITRNALFAFAASILTLLSPADTSIFNMVTVNIQLALTALIAGCYFFVLSWDYGRGWWIPMWVALGLAVSTYEAVYAVILFGPLLLIWQVGRPNRRMIAFSAAWYAPALLMLTYSAYLILGNPRTLGYQQQLTSTPVSLGDMVNALGKFVHRLFFKGWWPVFLNSELRWYERTAAITVLIVSFISLYVSPKSAGRRYLILSITGAFLVVLTSLVYLPTSLRLTYDRTLMFSGVGAAICVAALLWWLLVRFPLGRVIYIVLLAFIAMVGINGLIGQHFYYQSEALSQREVLMQIVDVTGSVTPNTVVVVLDQSQHSRVRTSFLTYVFYADRAWQVIQYPNLTNLILCYPDDLDGWGIFNEHCEFDSNGVAIWSSNAARTHFPAEQLVVLTYSDDSGVQLVPADMLPFSPSAYDPTSRIQPGVLPHRAETMLGMTP